MAGDEERDDPVYGLQRAADFGAKAKVTDNRAIKSSLEAVAREFEYRAAALATRKTA
jgi:hypothetical protein